MHHFALFKISTCKFACFGPFCFVVFHGFQVSNVTAKENQLCVAQVEPLVDSFTNAYNRSKNLVKLATKKLESNLLAQPESPFEYFGGYRIGNNGFKRPSTFPLGLEIISMKTFRFSGK